MAGAIPARTGAAGSRAAAARRGARCNVLAARARRAVIAAQKSQIGAVFDWFGWVFLRNERKVPVRASFLARDQASTKAMRQQNHG
jgi:hypothetical protein